MSTETKPPAPADIAACQAELASLNDRYLRLAADFDNFRRRTQQESERRAAGQKEAFIRELLPVIDNLERALASHPSTSAEQLRTGVQMTLTQVREVLRRHGIEVEESVGQPFDAHRHEAIDSRFEPSQPDHVVLDVVQSGYRRGQEVFRPAKVIVNDLNDTGSESNAG